MGTGFRNYNKYKALLWEFAKKDIKLKYRNSFLGILWSMLNPLLIMIVLTFIFSNIFKNKIHNFPVYCLSGRLLYSYFSQTTNQCMKSIVNKSSLIKKIYIPKYIYPLSKAISAFIMFLISLIPLIIMMLFTNVHINKMTIFSLFPLLSLFFISLGVGLVLATLNVFFRDMEHLYSVILMIIMYMSAIFYSPDIISTKYVFVLKLNPIFPVISVFRDCILYGEITSLGNWMLCFIYPIILVLIGVYVFCKKQDKFIFYI